METFNGSPRMLSPKIPPTSSEGLRPETSPSGAMYGKQNPLEEIMKTHVLKGTPPGKPMAATQK